MEKCQSIFGHRFVARYSEEPVLPTDAMMRAVQVVREASFPQFIKRTYEGDVCVRCGAQPEPRIEIEIAKATP